MRRTYFLFYVHRKSLETHPLADIETEFQGMPYIPDLKYFEPRPDKNRKRYFRCKICVPSRDQEAHNCRQHEESIPHKRALQNLQRLQHAQAPQPPNAAPPAPSPSAALLPFTDELITEDGMRAFLVACSADPSQPLYPAGHPLLAYSDGNIDVPPGSSPVTGINWQLLNVQEAFEEAEVSPYVELRRQAAQISLDRLLNGDIDDISDTEVETGVLPSNFYDPDVSSVHSNDLPQKRARAGDTDPKTAREWYPWPDRISCTLDVLMHLPRSVFSRRQLNLFLWLLQVNQVNNVPSAKSTSTLNAALQNMCGIETHQYQGKLGHPYSVNSLAQILAQEMCNPRVRPHLHFYPEDTGKRVEEFRQASNWLHEMPPDDATPMVRIAQKGDFYIYEPTMLSNQTFCVPFRWYRRDGKFHGRGWTLEHKGQGVDETDTGWVVRKDLPVNFSEEMLYLTFPQLSATHQSYDVSHPSRIIGVRSEDLSDLTLGKWLHTNPVLGNRWRGLAKGHRTLSIPLWMYCDDTSGNQSKRWNEHNSFLFTLAGLPREEVSKEYNVHFLCTSNLAPPLEMLDGVVEQIENAKANGIWAWDCVDKEPVLLAPTPVSKLGDNPMQSEFCCHVGSRGKFFCRICMVKGTDVEDSKVGSGSARNDHTPSNSPASSVAANSGTSDTEARTTPTPTPNPPTSTTEADVGKPKKKAPVLESMPAMYRRVFDFMKPGEPRTKKKTQDILASFFNDAKILYAKSKLIKRRTETGVKDTIQEFFLDKLYLSYKDVRGTTNKQKALDDAISALPDEITSPIWRLGLDPHRDTPVEILHVVLLGFVKYFWRDLVQNQVNDDEKKTLITRLDSLNVDGLGISRLAGTTLVNYAGSLTGRDFRVISQIAPFVIYDMVPPPVFDAWVSLSTLVPLIWQPIIEDIDEFCRTLETEIQNFLVKTVKWTCAWFNKAKFHILLHLPNHIRRFGPAILFATEAFESFNAVIRAKSIHSNRQAPSRDIALAFAQGNRIRHLISGGLILKEDKLDKRDSLYEGLTHSDWASVGPGPQSLMLQDPTPLSYLGLEEKETSSPGCLKPHKTPPKLWRETLAGKHLSQSLDKIPPDARFAMYHSITLENGDVGSLGSYIIVQGTPSYFACIREIPRFTRSEQVNMPLGILLQKAQLIPGPLPLPMPRLVLQNVWVFESLSNLLCTVNVQHDCRRHQCQASGVRAVVQERLQSTKTVPVVQHLVCPDDLILNTAQMRDAIHLQKFRQPSSFLDNAAIAGVVQQSVAQAIDARKSAQSSRGKTGRGRGRGRGTPVREPETSSRGRGRGRGSGLGSTPLSSGERIIDFS